RPLDGTPGRQPFALAQAGLGIRFGDTHSSIIAARWSLEGLRSNPATPAPSEPASEGWHRTAGVCAHRLAT
ncbi:MAG TPA: hypothetical protein VN045_09010, partial [Microbacteriaceae bacterium]|nr:hypothetical protein [Microbacteriaceae bacterium]